MMYDFTVSLTKKTNFSTASFESVLTVFINKYVHYNYNLFKDNGSFNDDTTTRYYNILLNLREVFSF